MHEYGELLVVLALRVVQHTLAFLLDCWLLTCKWILLSCDVWLDDVWYRDQLSWLLLVPIGGRTGLV